MKIIFLCGCLEPGRDGVGDYTRRLSSELINSNHQPAIIGLNDRFISENREEVQHDNGLPVSVARFASSVSWEARVKGARSFLQSFDPDWVSLQFVPFSFHTKGLLFKLPSYLKEMGGGEKLHIMFHELWVGMDKNILHKHFWWGWLQKYLIGQMLKQLNPEVIHTNTEVYKIQLGKMGYKASKLPLFSNITVGEGRTNNKMDTISSLTREISFILFAHIQPGAPVELFTKELLAIIGKDKTRVVLKLIGRNGSEIQIWKSTWLECGFGVEILGEQPVDIVSSVLSNGSFGISTTPYMQIEKSGAVAAMTEHGLPVICVARNWQAKDIPRPSVIEGVYEYKIGELKNILLAPHVLKKGSRLPNVADDLINSLHSI